MKNFPSRNTILKQFPSWKEALIEAGVQVKNQRDLQAQEFETNNPSLTEFLDWCLN